MREKILSATAKIIATEGLDAVSIRHVCDKVGVKAPTVYYYFKDKDGLVEAVVGLAYKRYAKAQFDFVNNVAPMKALAKTWDVFFELVEKETDLWHAIIIAHIRQRIPPEGFELFYSIAEIFKTLEEQGKLKHPYLISAEIFYANAYGLALVYISQGMTPNLKGHIAFSRDLTLKSLLVD